MNDYKRIQEMLYGLPNTQPVYTQKGTTTVDLDEMRAEIARLQAREAKLRDALAEVLENVKKRKGTDGEGRLSIHDITIMRAAIAKAGE
jgi:hypothetical protein